MKNMLLYRVTEDSTGRPGLILRGKTNAPRQRSPNSVQVQMWSVPKGHGGPEGQPCVCRGPGHVFLRR